MLRKFPLLHVFAAFTVFSVFLKYIRFGDGGQRLEHEQLGDDLTCRNLKQRLWKKEDFQHAHITVHIVHSLLLNFLGNHSVSLPISIVWWFLFHLNITVESSLRASLLMQSDQNTKKVEFSLDIPLEVTGLVVGKKGTTIKQIKQTSKANVLLSADPLPDNEKLKRLTIQGSRREVENAQDQIVKLLNSWCGFESETGEDHKNIDLLPTQTREIVLAYKTKQGQYSRGAPANQGHNPHNTANHTASQYPAQLHHVSERPTYPKAQYATEQTNNYEARNSATNNAYYDNIAAMNGQQQGYRSTAQTAVVSPGVGSTEALHNHRVELEVPRACISYIVGKEYENIAHLERTSGAQIFPVEPAPGDNPTTIRIVFVGTELAALTARANFWQVTVTISLFLLICLRSELHGWALFRPFNNGLLAFSNASKLLLQIQQ